MKHYEVVTVGSALKDIMFHSDGLFVIKSDDVKQQKLLAVEYGTKIPIKEVFVNYGGGAMNTAVGLANFGIFTAPLACIGDDQMGREIYCHLKEKKIDASLLHFTKQAKTGFSIIVSSLKDREHTIFTHKGASAFLQLPSLRNFQTDWFYVSALSGENWASETDKIMRQAKRGVKIAWNPGAAQLAKHKIILNFLPAVELFILNKDEAIELVCAAKPKTKKSKLKDSRFLLAEIKSFGPRKAVITQSAKGAMAVDENGRHYYYPAASDPKRIVDTVGAGDAFSSGLIAGLIRFKDFDRAMQLGMKNSAAVLYRVGAQNGLLRMKL
ncbi:MAG: carbohydrate kinase family protein [Parcubacteria group bacterium]